LQEIHWEFKGSVCFCKGKFGKKGLMIVAMVVNYAGSLIIYGMRQLCLVFSVYLSLLFCGLVFKKFISFLVLIVRSPVLSRNNCCRPLIYLLLKKWCYIGIH
jgi:hypothetical protein